MRVLITAGQLRRRVPGGIGTYVRSLFSGLAEVGGVEAQAWAPRWPAGPLGLGPGVPERLSALPATLLTRAWDLNRCTPPGDVDRVHAASVAVPARRRPTPPMSCFVHDLAWRRVPDAYPRRGRRWHDAALARAITRCDLLMVPSSQTADDLLAAGARHQSVHLVAEGCDHLPLHGRVAGGGTFLLSVSTLEPRKNLRRLVEAYSLARPHLAHPWPMRIVGPAGWGDDLADLATVDGVELLGHVGDEDLALLLSQARALAYVPLVEGYGLPAVEAMRAGLPVLSSPVPSVVPGTAVTVDPSDVHAMATALALVLDDDDLRASISGNATRHVAALTWRASAAAHLELWEAAT